MEKCTETCPKCGAAYRNQFNESDSNGTIDYWECDSFRRNIHGPEIRHSTKCQLAAANAEIERLRAQVERLKSEMTNSQLHNACE